MRKTLPVLALLSILAVSAAAQSTASTTSTTTATYSASSAALTLTGLSQGLYDHGTPDYDDAGGTTALTHTGSASGTQSGTTLTTTSTTSVSLNSANYAAVGSLAYSDVFEGYHYYLTFTNASATTQTLAFAIGVSQIESVAAASPYGRAAYLDTAGDLGTGAYAYSATYGGIIDITDPMNEDLTYTEISSIETANASLLGTSTPYATSTIGQTFEADFALAAGATRTYLVYASNESYVQFAPQAVPEPSALAALGLGALCLLKRRRR